VLRRARPSSSVALVASMSLVNLGGPGWISDVFSLDIIVNQERTISCHSLLFQEKCPVSSFTMFQDGCYSFVRLAGIVIRDVHWLSQDCPPRGLYCAPQRDWVAI